MAEETKLLQISMKIDLSTSESLQRMADEAGTTPTTVARALLMAAIRQAESGHDGPLPPYLARFYGIQSMENDS